MECKCFCPSDSVNSLYFPLKGTAVVTTARLLRQSISSLVRSVKVSLVEQMRRSLRARLKGMARLTVLENPQVRCY